MPVNLPSQKSLDISKSNKLKPSLSKEIQPQGSWQDWWKKKEEMNQALIKAVKLKDLSKVKDSLN